MDQTFAERLARIERGLSPIAKEAASGEADLARAALRRPISSAGRDAAWAVLSIPLGLLIGAAVILAGHWFDVAVLETAPPEPGRPLFLSHVSLGGAVLASVALDQIFRLPATGKLAVAAAFVGTLWFLGDLVAAASALFAEFGAGRIGR